MTTVFDGVLFADYHQFYLIDADSDVDYSGEINDDAVAQRVVWKDDVLVVFTARNMDVSVAVQLHKQEPALDLQSTDHVVEAGLRTSGTIIIAGCTDYLPEAVRVPVPPGDLRAWIVFTGLGTLSEDGLEGEDRYVVHLWPGTADSVRVIKQG